MDYWRRGRVIRKGEEGLFLLFLPLPWLERETDEKRLKKKTRGRGSSILDGLPKKGERQPYTGRKEEISNSLGEDHRKKVGRWIHGWKVDFLFLEKLTSLGREPSTNCTILYTLLVCIRKYGRTEGFWRKIRETTFGLTDGKILNTQIVLVNPAAKVDVAKPELVFVSSEFSYCMSLLNLHFA